jgi:enoyl-CoA hydratase
VSDVRSTPSDDGFEFLTVTRPAAGVMVVTLDRPPVNAFGQPFYAELQRCLDGVEHDEDVAVVVLTGAGSVFCAGNDLDEFVSMTPENGTARMREVMRTFRSLYGCAAPVVAAVNGAALGTGMALVCCCDVVVSSDRATYGLPEINVGVFGGAAFLARMVPEQTVRRMFLTGEPVSAARFHELGAPIEVVPHDELLTSALALAGTIAAKTPRATRLAHDAFNHAEPLDMFSGYAVEQTYTVTASGHPESKQAVREILDELAARRAARTGGA